MGSMRSINQRATDLSPEQVLQEIKPTQRKISTLTQPQAQRLKAQVDRDKDFVGLVRMTAETARTAPSYGPMQFDITGRPDAAQEFNKFQKEMRKSLAKVEEELFFARVTAREVHRGVESAFTLLLSRSNDVGTKVLGEDWNLVCWTDPVSRDLLATPINETLEYAAPSPNGYGYRPPVTYTVVATAKIRQLEPMIADALYENVDGKFYIDSEDALLAPVIALGDAPPPREYQSATVFGLGDIIEDADQAQRVAMHLAFKKSVLIDGPPGSGKTSIGIMRIPCLKFQQWEAMGLNRQKDVPFHTDSSMRVLVFSDEMKEYLSTLVKDLRVGVEVQTTHKFLFKLARDAKVLTGRPVRERPSVASLKSQKEVLAAYWAGFQSHSGKVWAQQKEELRQALGATGQFGKQLYDLVARWATTVAETPVVNNVPKAPVSLAESLSRWLMQQRRALPEAERVPPMPGPNVSREAARAALSQREAVIRENEAAREAKLKFDSNVKAVRDLLARLAAQLSDRAAIYGAMFDSVRFKDVLDAAADRGLSAKQIQIGLKRWKEQQANGCVTASEYDAALCAWLGVYVFSVADDNAQLLVGGRRTRLTHLVVDEVQDLSPCHIPVLASTLVRDGTLTLVGDVRQNLNQYGGLRSWREVLDHVADHKTFGTNYRQTQELGSFVRQLHGVLFSETPQWQPSDRLSGPIPTAIEVGGAGKLASAVADEIRRIRERLPGATVGLLYDGNLDPSRMRKFARRIGDLLADTSTEVHLATKSAAGAKLRETDCVIIASVKETKGLEFDAVVFMSANYTLTKPVSEIPLKRRNGLYVATSRARHSLAIVMRKLPEYFGPLEIGGVVEIKRLDQDL